MSTTPVETTPIQPIPPRAPTVEEWERLSVEQRQQLEEDLYLAAVEYEEALRERMTDEERAAMAEGDIHSGASFDTRAALRAYYKRKGGNLYIASNLAVFYPGETHFDPDLLAVWDVPLRNRDSYIVQNEGKGLDLVIENLYKGRRKKDLVDNVVRYARLGIPEYFVVDLKKARIHAHHLVAGGRRYSPLLGDRGRYRSEVLGLDITIENGELRFYSGTARVPLLEELVAAAGEAAAAAKDEAAAAKDEAAAAKDEAAAAKDEAEQLRQGLADSILTILHLRGLPVTDAQHRQVKTCKEAVLLQRWLSRAATATLDELFLDS